MKGSKVCLTLAAYEAQYCNKPAGAPSNYRCCNTGVDSVRLSIGACAQCVHQKCAHMCRGA